MSTSDTLAVSNTRALRLDGVALAAALATLLCVTPVLVVLVLAAFGTGEGVTFGANLTRDGAIGTLLLMLAGGGGAIAFGAGAAWLVSFRAVACWSGCLSSHLRRRRTSSPIRTRASLGPAA
jgi:hypothetical protein